MARSYPVDDSKSADPKASEICQLVPQRLAGGRILSNQVETGSNLLLQIGMEAPDELVDACRDAETIGLHQA
jgi:hypothetical protein